MVRLAISKIADNGSIPFPCAKICHAKRQVKCPIFNLHGANFGILLVSGEVVMR